MIYRIASSKDFNQVLEIERECFKQPYTSKELEYEFYENPVNKIIVAEDNGKIVGFIDFLITFNSSTIMQVAVTGSHRKQGIGTNLLKEMEKSFPKEIQDLVETITLEVRESNDSARKMYEKNGYETVTIKKAYYKDGENAVYMLKRL